MIFRNAFFAIVCFFLMGVEASTTKKVSVEDYFAIGKGDVELGVNVASRFSNNQASGQNNVFSFDIHGNYLLTKIIAPGLDVVIQDTGSVSEFRVLPNVKFFLPNTQRLTPFFKLGFGYANLPGADGFDVNVGAGIGYLLSNSVGISLEARYDLILADNRTISKFEIPIGFNLYFKL